VKGDVLLAGANLNSGGTVEGNIGGNLKVFTWQCHFQLSIIFLSLLSEVSSFSDII
jgi:hypothetical protein